MQDILSPTGHPQGRGATIPVSPVSVRAPGDEIDLRALLLMLWRRKLVIVACLCIGLSLALLALALLPPRYSARALLLIEMPMLQNAANDLRLMAGAKKPDTVLVLSEIEVLRSRVLAAAVVQKLGLMNDPEFNPRLLAPAGPDRAFRHFSVDGTALKTLPAAALEQEMADVVTVFLDHLQVRAVPGSLAIQLDFTSARPGRAALIANTLADTYIDTRLAAKLNAAKKLAFWLDGRLGDLRRQVRESEAAVEAYRAQHNLAEGARSSISAEQLSALNAQLIAARGQQAEVRARLAQIKNFSGDMSALETTADVLNSDIIRKLKLEFARTEADVSELSQRYGDKHPEMIKKKAELEELQKSMQGEILKIRETANSDLQLADARVGALEDSLAEVTGRRNLDNGAMIRLRELEREAESSRLIFDTFLETYKRTDQQEALQEPEARVISYAALPRQPSFPNRPLVLSLGALLSVFCGLGLALLLEKLDNSFRSAVQLERATGISCYALIPHAGKMDKIKLGRYTVENPASATAESVRSLRAALNLRAEAPAKKPKVITVTSSFSGEGKTTLSLWMARQAARSGEKVVVIDADLRRPNLHNIVGTKNDVTLADILAGQKNFEDVVRKEAATGLDLIYARAVPAQALDLIGGQAMEALVRRLSCEYDLVILDSPASMAVSDARVLAKLSDQILYVVAWDKTPCEAVIGGARQFTAMNCENMAFVLMGVDVQRHVRYGYADTVYYGYSNS
jgi:capsular exopolysaccharide synthesis family protein